MTERMRSAEEFTTENGEQLEMNEILQSNSNSDSNILVNDIENNEAEKGDEESVTWVTETGHYFYRKTFKKPVHCQLCESFIWGIRKQGLACEVCGLILHEKCVLDVTSKCYVPTAIEGHDYTKSIALKHNWISGNIGIAKKCIVCSKLAHNISGSFHSFQCSHCQQVVHKECVNTVGECMSDLTSILFCHELMKQSLPNYTPLLVFVNTKSGGQQGQSVIRRLRRLLCAEQVIDLFASKGPSTALHQYIHVPNLKILVCGGDGTACWIMSVIDKMENIPEKVPAIAVIPLGTGNDLARVLNFGGGYDGESLKPILRSIITNSIEIPLDRWTIDIEEEDGKQSSYVINNYFSFGLDAKIALKFHELREENPQLFKNRTINKGFYGGFGLQNIIVHPHTVKELDFKLNVDGNDIDLSKFEGLECVVFLNIPSYAGGTNLWGNVQENNESGWVPCSMSDGKLEVIGVNNVAHILGLQTKLIHGTRIAQGSNFKFQVQSVEFQVDGEPFKVKNCSVVIRMHRVSNLIQIVK